MLESVLAHVLNNIFGQFVQDLDTEQLDVGLFKGELALFDLKLRHDLLAVLDLPVEVKAGNIGKVNIIIPWSSLLSQPVVVTIEDVFVVAGPICDRRYDAERERQLQRAHKRAKLARLEDHSFKKDGLPQSRGFLENLTASILHNLQISVRNVHIRYEDTVTDPEIPFACGLCLQSISVETTNSKWKTTQVTANASSVFKLVRFEACSFYWNPRCVRKNLARNNLSSNGWKTSMQRSMQMLSFNGEELEFVMKPLTAKVKVIMNKSNEARVPKLLLDFVLQDATFQFTRQQYLSMLAFSNSLQRMKVNRYFHKYRPNVKVPGHAKAWWHYAYKSIVQVFIKPCSWESVLKHRTDFYEYKNLYRRYLVMPNDLELENELYCLEDKLDITNIILAREHAKIELSCMHPTKISLKEKNSNWWSIWPTNEENVELEVISEPKKTLWSTLSAADKYTLYDAIGYAEGWQDAVWQRHYIEHKVNFTLGNCTLTFVCGGQEVMMATLTQFLVSIETRPAAEAFKISTRVESFLVEGMSEQNDLMTVLTAENLNSGRSYPHVLSLDFEKNPISVSADVGLSVTLEAVEVMYNERAVSNFINFFQVEKTDLKQVTTVAINQMTQLADVGIAVVKYAIAKRKTAFLTLDIKSPFFVVPEHGSLHRGGNLLVLDLGHIHMHSDLQGDPNILHEATRMELEEHLYDRFVLSLTNVQVLFCDSGENWRDLRNSLESDHHLVPKITCDVVFSNSVEPSFRQLPSQKLNVVVPRLKLSMSDRKLRQLMDFAQHLPLPRPCEDQGFDCVDGIEKPYVRWCPPSLQELIKEIPVSELRRIAKAAGGWELLYRLQAGRSSVDSGRRSSVASSVQGIDNDRCLSITDTSEEEREEFARNVDLPGFDDNVSPHSTIRVLLRIMFGEVVVQLARSSNHVDKPYLLLRMDKCVLDIAFMEYGPALQASLENLQLVDKFHPGPSGEYLELIATKSPSDLLTVLYRKVRADCPDFKSHFHSVEQSLVITLDVLQIAFHRGAFIMLNKYLEYLLERVKGKELWLKTAANRSSTLCSRLFTDSVESPVPPGATKFSYSMRLGQIAVKLLDSDADLMELRLSGLECDCYFKANERKVVRVYLTDFQAEDLTPGTLYPKILCTEEDKVFDFKYVRHSPKVSQPSEIGSRRENGKSDGSVRFRIGRLQFVYLRKIFTALQHFVEPFIHPDVTVSTIRSMEKTVESQMEQMRTKGMLCLNISLEFHAPTILIPQKCGSPNLLVINMGDLTVENFFKQAQPRQNVTSSRHTASQQHAAPLIDNILLRLQSLQMTRAVYSMSGSLEAQEPILEPVNLRLDLKRAIPPVPREFLHFELQGNLDMIRLSLGQRDLSTIWAVWQDNVNEGRFIDVQPLSHPTSPVAPPTPTPMPRLLTEDSTMKRLQTFFSQSIEVVRETTVAITLEGLQLTLYADDDEVVSSPVRDINHALCKFELEEVSLAVDIFSDRSLEITTALQMCSLEDMRPESNLVLRRIFQSYSGEAKNNVGPISVSMPPMIDLTYKQNQNGDASVDVIVEKTRFNVSVPFFLALAKFVTDAVPYNKSVETNALSHGCVAELGPKSPLRGCRPPSSTGSTSGYFSTGTSAFEEHVGMSVAIKLKKPEIVLLADPMDKNSPVLVLRTEITFDYSRNLGQATVSANASGLHVLSCHYGQKRQTAYVVLQPCDIDFNKNFRSLDEGYRLVLDISPLEFHISASIVTNIVDVVNEITSSLKHSLRRSDDLPPDSCKELEDLWTPKKLLPYTVIGNAGSSLYERPSYPTVKPSETFVISMPNVHIFFEAEDGSARIPVVLVKTQCDAEIHDWSRQMHSKFEVQLEIQYYNENVSTWEPIIEPCMVKENIYKPWEGIIKVFMGKAYPIAANSIEKCTEETDGCLGKSRNNDNNESETSDEESDAENRMVIIRKPESARMRKTTSIYDSRRLIGYPGDSDSETEDGTLEKIASAFGHMFTGDSSDDELSDGEESSPEDKTEFTEQSGSEETDDGKSVFETDSGFQCRKEDSVDSGLDTENHEKQAIYVLCDSRDKFELTFTPTSLKILKDLADAFASKSPNDALPFPGYNKSLHVDNFVDVKSFVSILSKNEGLPGSTMRVEATAAGEKSDSRSSSPASIAHLVEDLPGNSDDDLESMETGFSVSSALGHIGNMMIQQPVTAYKEDTVDGLYKTATKERIELKVAGFDKMTVLMPTRTSCKLFSLLPMRHNTRYHVAVDVKIMFRQRTVVVRSPLQVRNSTCHPIHLFYKSTSLKAIGIEDESEIKNPFSDIVKLGTVGPEEIFNVPLYVAYHCKLYAQPATINDHDISEKGLWWQELAGSLNMPKDFCCLPKDTEQTAVFAFRVICIPGTDCGSLQASVSRQVPNYIIHLVPPVTFHNHLPYALELKMPTGALGINLDAGEKCHIYSLDMKKNNHIQVHVPNYLDIPWGGTFDLSHDVEEKMLTMTTDFDTEGGNKQLGLNVKVLHNGSLDVYLCAPYWIINKTALPLQIRGSSSEIVYESQSEGPILFRYKKRRRKKVRLRVYDSSWSSAFSIDTLGSSGLVVCRCRQRKRRYRILVTIASTSLYSFTKIVTFLPCFLVANSTQKPLRFMEESDKADLWMDILPGQCIPFWPDTKSMKMFVKYQDSKVVSQHFFFNKPHRTVLRMDRGGALCVEVSGGTDCPFTTVFKTYNGGDAVVRVDNMCEDLFLKINQKASGQVALLSPYQSLMYTWDDPTQERTLIWNIYNRKLSGFVAQFGKDCYGQERVSFQTLRQSTVSQSSTTSRCKPSSYGSSSTDDDDSDGPDQKSQFSKRGVRKDKVIVYWVSYLEGHQRVLLFTQDERIARQAQTMICMEKSSIEFFFSLAALGISLSNSKSKEVAYLSISSGPPVWEVEVAHRWKLLSLELASWLEDQWQHSSSRADMKEFVHVDFEKMLMTKPFFGDLRRTTNPGIWFQFRCSVHQYYLHLKIHRMQLDNQLLDAVFPTVFCPSPMPASAVKKLGVRPCLEVASLWRRSSSSQQQIYRYMKVLLQEYSVWVDKGFILSLYDVFAGLFPAIDEAVSIRSDIASVHIPLSKIAAMYGSEEVKAVIEYAHISPVKIHFNFSPRGTPYCTNSHQSFVKSDILEFFLNSVGATLTEAKDVEFRLGFYEQRGAMLSRSELVSQVYNHYASQLLQQFYVIVLGLDVLGNPFRLVKDFTHGLEDFFYEPFLGALDGPEQFTEGVATGVKSLLGHVVGGCAGSAALITGSAGELLTALSFDEDYKRKRRQWMQQRSDLPITLANAGRTFALGVILGLSGLIVKPITGIQQDGVEGFFKGVGRGLLGLVTKPAAGVLDCVSLVFDGVRRASEMGEEVVMRMRLPRYLNPYTGLRPYSVHQARGLVLLHLLDRGHFSDTDVYWAHAPLSQEERSDLVLVTNRHVFLLSRGRLWGGWEIQWSVEVDDIMAVPHLEANKLVLKIREDTTVNVFSDGKRCLESVDAVLLRWLQNKLEQVLILSMEDKPYPEDGDV